MAPATELTLSGTWLMEVGLSMMDTDRKVDEEHEEEGKEGVRRGKIGLSYLVPRGRDFLVSLCLTVCRA